MRTISRKAIVSILIAASLAASTLPGADAASANYTGTTDSFWVTAGNWSTGLAPGAVTGTTNTDTATFNGTGSSRTSVVIDSGRNLEYLTFDLAAAAAYVIGTTGGNALLLTSGGAITVNAAVTTAQAVNAPLVLEGDGAVYSFSDNSTTATALLTIGGSVTGSSGSGSTTVLTLAGTNPGAAGSNISGVVGNGANGGALALIKSGVGYWALTGLNTYSGSTSITGGTLTIGTLANGGSASAIGESSNAASNLIISGGTLLFNGSSTTVDRGITVGSVSGGTINVSLLAANLTFSGSALSSSTANAILTKSGPGILTLAGSTDNPYLGANVTAGTLVLSKSSTSAIHALNATLTVSGGFLTLAGTGGDQIADTAGVTVNSGTFDLAGESETIGVLSGTGGVITDSVASTTSTLTMNGGSFSGNLQDTGTGTTAGKLALTLSANLALSGTNSYSGATNIGNKFLTISTATALPAATTLTMSNGGQLAVSASGTYNNILNLAGSAGISNYDPSLNSGALRLTGSTGSFILGGAATITGNTEIAQYANSSTATLNGIIGGTGNLILAGAATTASGSVIYSLGADETYSGTTTVLGKSTAQVVLQLSGTGLLPTSTVLTLQGGNGGRAGLDLKGQTQSLAGLTTALPIDSGSATNNISNTVTSQGTLILTGGGSFNGNIGSSTGSNIALILNAAGSTLTLSGTNSYSGGTTITAGTLSGTATSFSSGAISTGAAGTLSINQSSAGTLSNTITGAGNLTISGGAIITLASSNSFTGGTLVSGGTVTGGTVNYSTGNVSVSSGATADYTQSVDSTYTPNIGGAGFVTVHAIGHVITYAGVDSAGGGTTISGGTLLLNHSGGGGLTGPVSVATGAILQLASDNQITATSPVNLSGGTFSANGHNDAVIVDSTHATAGMGTLAVPITSTLDFGDATGSANGGAGVVLAFTDSSAVSWGGTLIITNYKASADQLYIGTNGSGLTSSQLSHITFGGVPAQQRSTGQIIFVPEPNSWISLLIGIAGLVGMTAFQRRHSAAIR